MKTAISIPDDTFALVERTAQELGMNRSQFFTRAVEHYVRELESTGLTAQIDEALERGSADDSADVTAVGRSRLAQATAGDDW
jgi:predicted DNA-binding protein